MTIAAVSADITIGSSAIYLAPAGTGLPTLTHLPIDWTSPMYTSPGYTKGGVELTYTPTFLDINVDEEMASVRKVITAEKLVLKAQLSQATINNLNFAIAGGTVVTDTERTTLYLGSPLQSALKSWVLGIEAPAPGLDKTRVILVYNVMAIGAVAIKPTKTAEQLWDVEFEALADGTKANGKRLAEINDYLSTAS